jgi:hypothetical protein
MDAKDILDSSSMSHFLNDDDEDGGGDEGGGGGLRESVQIFKKAPSVAAGAGGSALGVEVDIIHKALKVDGFKSQSSGQMYFKLIVNNWQNIKSMK